MATEAAEVIIAGLWGLKTDASRGLRVTVVNETTVARSGTAGEAWLLRWRLDQKVLVEAQIEVLVARSLLKCTWEVELLRAPLRGGVSSHDLEGKNEGLEVLKVLW